MNSPSLISQKTYAGRCYSAARSPELLSTSETDLKTYTAVVVSVRKLVETTTNVSEEHNYN